MIRWIFLGACATLVTACGSNTFTDRSARLQFPPPTSGGATDSGTTAKADPEQTIVENFRSPDPTKRNGMTPRQYRDSIIWRIIARDEDTFHDFTRLVRSDRALMNMSADGGVIFLNSLAAVTGTAGEKAALAVLSAGLLSAKGSVDRQLFNQETMNALLARMHAARLQALVPIKRGLTLPTDVYPLEQALVELRGLANAGSLLATVQAITADAGEKADQAAAEIESRDSTFIESLDRRDEIGERITALKGRQLLVLATTMDGYLAAAPSSVQTELLRTDPRADRRKDPKVALSFLTTWLADDPGAGGVEWQEAVSAAEKVKP